MHVPDGFLNVETSVSMIVLSAVGISWAARKLRDNLPARRIPLLGVSAAFVFAAQMLNFPVAGGTSGHLIGAVLVSVLLGPSAAVLVMSSVLFVQCLVFADGGLLALGANIFNMAIVGVLGGYLVYAAVSSRISGLKGRLAACAFASWCSVVCASLCCAVELAASGSAPWGLVFPAMTAVHMVIGVGEAVITTLVVAVIAELRPELVLGSTSVADKMILTVVKWGLVASLVFAVLLSPFASPFPDGLEYVAEKLDFIDKGEGSPIIAPLVPDYELPGLSSPIMATALAGLVGTLMMFVFSCLFGWIVAGRQGPRFEVDRLSN